MRNFFNQVIAGINSRIINTVSEQSTQKPKKQRTFIASKTTTIKYSKSRRDPALRWK